MHLGQFRKAFGRKLNELRSTGSIAGGSFQIHFSPKPLKIQP